MINRLYVHNYRCLENFEINLSGLSSALLIGNNGVGKSAISRSLEILQKIARGTNRMRDLENSSNYILGKNDFTRGRTEIPMRFEIEVFLDDKLYKYHLALELPEKFNELRVSSEELQVDDQIIFSRNTSSVTFWGSEPKPEAKFSVNWHLAALPIIQESNNKSSLKRFRSWLASMVILAPVPSKMTGEAVDETLEPEKDGSNFSGWLDGLLSVYPAAYTQLERYLREVMPDIQDFHAPHTDFGRKKQVVRFRKNGSSFNIDFNDLSDGEKCYFLTAALIAANSSYGPIFCFWDEPDNFLSLQEVGNFSMALRKAFHNNGQVLLTSHNPEIIRTFSNENTFLLDRKSHSEPTLIRSLQDLPTNGELINKLLLGDLSI